MHIGVTAEWKTVNREEKSVTGPSEPRHFEFEIFAAANARGTSKLTAYALYYVCEDVGGTCRFLRQDIPITVTVKLLKVPIPLTLPKERYRSKL